MNKILLNVLGYSVESAKNDVEMFFSEYDSAHHSGFIKYADIETDYLFFIDTERKMGRLTRVTTLSTILFMLKNHVERTG